MRTHDSLGSTLLLNFSFLSEYTDNILTVFNSQLIKYIEVFKFK